MGFILLSSITFLSAFLLFQIELIMAKLFLPNYGGSYLVWGACVVFFQGGLLAGYLFAHKMIVNKTIQIYSKIHLGLLFLPFLFFPGRMIVLPHDTTTWPLVLDIFFKLLLSVGPVFFVLSTISLVTQSWLSSSHLPQKKNPYALYAVSNLGSFAGLLTYPFLFELYLSNTEQLNIWRVAYVVLVGLNIWAYKKVTFDKTPIVQEEKIPVNWSQAWSWLCLSAGGVVLFLSVTNIMTYEIAPVPLLWIIPLSIYLLSFVLNFKNKPFSPAWITRLIFTIVVLSVACYFLSKVYIVSALIPIAVFSILLFLLCMFIQAELVRTKPKAQNLTFFYVMISLGGFLGGILISWIIPLVSNNLVEFLVGLLLLGLGSKRWGIVILTATAVVFSSAIENKIKNHESVLKKRNYYGIYDIFDSKGLRLMLHGTTLHGVQLLDPQQRWIPIGYYSPTSPLGDVLTKGIFKLHRTAGIGLGAGTVAMYARADNPIDFYELDPDVVDLAQEHFWYLALAPGPIKHFIGDARISLEKQKDVLYDVIIVDAFGGDSIPMHLVNGDVTKLYKSHLNEGGVIVFHIPSRYFDLKPILAHIAADVGGYAAFKQTGDEGFTMRTMWAIITWDQDRYLKLISQENWEIIDSKSYPNIRSWSDDYSSILPIINWTQLRNSLKHLNQKS